MSQHNNKNVAHSIFQQLLNRARIKKEDFNLLLSRYGMERFLYRLSISPYKNRFILKGQNYHVTRDADLLGFGDPDLELFTKIFHYICSVAYKNDGVRITLVGLLNQARIPLQIDIGFGDTVTPAPEDIEYPTLFNSPPPRLKAYPRYTLVAKKLETMLKLEFANSRMKDFYDIWLLSRLFSFEGDVLRMAIENTFTRRRTPLPVSTPFAFTSTFYNDPQKQVQWRAFVKKSKPNVQVEGLASVIGFNAGDISGFLSPVFESLKVELPFENEWLPDQGWITHS